MNPTGTAQSLEILEKLQQTAPKDNPRLQALLSELSESLKKSSVQAEEAEKLLAEYEAAYEKLTAPANRIGIFLSWVEKDKGFALIALGDTEYVSVADDKIERDALRPSQRVRINESYAIVGLVESGEAGPIVKVSEVLGEQRIRLGNDMPGSEGRIVLRGAGLAETKIHAGDELRLDVSGRFAVEHFEKQETRDYFLEDVPVLPWEKIGGQKEAISLIRETIEQPLLHPEIFERFEQKPVKGILLYGPPGCGKTMIGKATAYNLTQEYSKRVGHTVKEYFMAISGPKILNMWLGETERMVREIFKTAREKAKDGRLVFIFMDEAESVLRTRSSGRLMNISNTVVPQFCAELDGLQSLDNVVLMLTSNRPDYIDPAVLRPGRIDRKVKISRPYRTASEEILGIYLHAGLPLDPALLAKWNGDADCARKELVEATMEDIWAKSKPNEFLKVMLRNGSSDTLYLKDLVSGALIRSIVDRAKEYAIRRAISNPTGNDGISLEDLQTAVRREYKENEIFPKSDTMEDWLQLLDYAPENVASVRPIGRNRGEEISRKTIV